MLAKAQNLLYSPADAEPSRNVKVHHHWVGAAGKTKTGAMNVENLWAQPVRANAGTNAPGSVAVTCGPADPHCAMTFINDPRGGPRNSLPERACRLVMQSTRTPLFRSADPFPNFSLFFCRSAVLYRRVIPRSRPPVSCCPRVDAPLAARQY